METKYYSVMSIQNGLAKFIDNDLIPSIPASSIKRGLVGAVAAVVIKKLDAILKNIAANETIQMLSVVDEKGDFDIETLLSGFVSQMPKTGYRIDVNALGFSMDITAEDVNKLYEYIKQS